MATIFNESTVTSEVAGTGALRQPLLTPQRVPGSAIRLDRFAIAPGGHLMLDVPATSAAWIEMLTGAAALERTGESHALGDTHIACLPPGRTVGIADSAHLPPANQPAATADALLAFLA